MFVLSFAICENVRLFQATSPLLEPKPRLLTVIISRGYLFCEMIDPEFNYFGQISRSGVARSYDSIIFLYILGTSILFSMKSAPFYIPLNLNILKNINQVFWKISFSLAMPDIYSWLDWCYRFLEQYQRTEVPFSSHYIKRYVILTWPIPGGVSFDNLVKAALVSFSNVKFAIFLNQISSILSICISKFKIFYFNKKCF